MNPFTALAEAFAARNSFADLPEPPGGRPWALLGLCGGSLFLNVVLVARVALDGGTAAEVAVEGAPAVAGVEAAAEVVAPEPVIAEIPADMHVVKASVTESLSRTFQLADPERANVVSAVYSRLFAFDLNLRTDLQKGDDVRVAYTWDGSLAHIAAASFASKKHGKTFTAYEFQATGDKVPSYWAEDGREAALRLVDGPVADYDQITSLLKDRPSHHGMDFKAAEGTPVVTPKAGKVTRVDWNWTNNGNCVEVAFADGTTAKFLHLSRTDVAPGASLAAGTQVGLVGNTGHSTAAHLHYELERNGRVVDPIDYHGTVRRSLPVSDMAAFKVESERLAAMLR